MMALLRNRRAVIVDVNPYGPGDRVQEHLVRVEYTDDDGPPEDTVLWEREPDATVIAPGDLPRVDKHEPMPPAEFDALVRAARWTAMTPYLEPQGTALAEAPIASPAFGAVQVDDFQIEPLLRALEMPRVSLLLADDVGLGKTIEAGLILTELLLRRRIRRVLILCPAALRTQWQQEMHDKFALHFDPVDRDATHALQKRLGLDANPWRTFPRIIASYHYLRQPDVLEAFRTTCRERDDRAGAEVRLPWDLLIVDEAHNLMPSSFGRDSDLARMLREISPWFEHKLFLTATPHNGHTRSFTGLLEQLDPVRFTQTGELTDSDRRRITQVVVRRLKSEINALDDAADRPRRFSSRHLEPLPLFFGRRERALNEAVFELRRAIKEIIIHWPGEAGRTGNFAIEVLAKRLLSSPATFAHSWFRFRRGIRGDEAAEAREVDAARRASDAELDDDAELEGRQRHAARVIGAWLQPHAARLTQPLAAVDAALAALGIEPRDEEDEARYHVSAPTDDARFARLTKLIDDKLRIDREWRADERLIVFTEYKATLDDLDRRLRAHYDDADGRLLTLYGGLDPAERDRIKAAFNDPHNAVRVLLATDAASEGLNLQATARYVLHYEVPWNPARLEQRNGRLDRHGQARNVTVFHFTSEDDADLRFIERVVQKVHDMRTDLGSLAEVFDAAFERRFLDFADPDTLDRQLTASAEEARGRAEVPREDTRDTHDHVARIDRLRRAADLTPDTLRATLAIALTLGAPAVADTCLDGPDAEGRFALSQIDRLRPDWRQLIDDTLRLTRGSAASAIPHLVFDPRWFIRPLGEQQRPVFRPRADTVLLHLGHPLFRRALATLARARFPRDGELRVSRWTVRRGPVPDGAAALLLLTVEEIAQNALRETFHHVVTTWRLPLTDDGPGDLLPYLDPIEDTPSTDAIDPTALDDARALWDEARQDIRRLLEARATERTALMKTRLADRLAAALATEKQRFTDRLAEVAQAMKSTTLRKIERERDKLRKSLQQTSILDRRAEELRLRDLEAELALRREHYDELLARLKREQTRVIERAIPRRHTLVGDVRILPVAIEIRLPAPGEQAR
ncbi:MAG: DISARM system SNF2-like helicase DrmD [bacterium]